MATALENNTLEAQPREAGTKNHARRVRQGGKIPAVVYGAGKDSMPITVDAITPPHEIPIKPTFFASTAGNERSKEFASTVAATA